jgi:GH25 family lysozyme M1 (1,4-beta-N-acetylmuramidase)
MNVFDMKEPKVRVCKGVQPYKHDSKPDMSGVKTTGVKVRGTGAATKGTMARGPMA